jgi:hypothetical protein
MKSMKYNRIVNNLIPLLLSISLGCSTNLEDKVKSYELAHNSHDVDEVMSLYTDDITFEVVGIWIKTGKEQVRGIAEWDLATNSNMIISDIEITEDTATFKLKEGNDWFRLIGIEYMYYEPCRIVFEDGLIKEIKAEATEDSRKAFNEVWPTFYEWLYKEKNEELSKLITAKGEFIYNFKNATMWLSLLKEWKELPAQL